MLKKIEAIIREDKLGDVKDALRDIGIRGMNVFEIRGQGRQGGITLAGRSGSYQVDLLPKIKLEIVCKDEQANQIVRVIADSARTGEIGDGKIFIYDVIDAVRIRSMEQGESAI